MRIEGTDIVCLQAQLAKIGMYKTMSAHLVLVLTHFGRRECSSFGQWARRDRSFQLDVCGPSFFRWRWRNVRMRRSTFIIKIQQHFSSLPTSISLPSTSRLPEIIVDLHISIVNINA